VKKFDMFNGFDTIPPREGRTDRRTDIWWQQKPRYA